jgi:serine/threonine protein kinase
VIEALVDTRALAEGSMAADAMPPDEPSTRDSFEVGRGTRIDRYELEECLGAGGMGVVYAARDSKLQRRVAVKLLRPGRSDQTSSDARKRLLREARTLARLSHPNVVTVFDVGEHGDQLFVAMELVEGGSLGTWLRRAQRTPDEIIDRLLEAARGLAAAHQAGVIHRDIKPDNILVGPDGRARVTDFGLATPVDAQSLRGEATRPSITDTRSLTRTGALLGTPVYMAPEQLDGNADARSDQWSFCMTLYEALAGVRPFVADLVARVPAIREGRLAPPAAGRHVPGWVRRIVLRGLRADPGERWPSIGAIVEALARGRAQRWPSASSSLQSVRRRSLRIVIAGLAMSIAGIATFAATRGSPSTSEAANTPEIGPANTPGSAPAPVALTCTDQPADQIAGVVAAGPDGASGTDDDVASWTLGRDVTDRVRGTSWKVDVAPPSPRPRAVPPKRSSNLTRRPTTGEPAPAKATDEATPSPPPPEQLAVDQDGIPTRRWGR